MLEICFRLQKLQTKVSSERRVRKGILFKQNCSFISINARGDIFAQWLEYIILFKRPVERGSIDKLILNQKLCDNTLISPHLTFSTWDKKKKKYRGCGWPNIGTSAYLHKLQGEMKLSHAQGQGWQGAQWRNQSPELLDRCHKEVPYISNGAVVKRSTTRVHPFTFPKSAIPRQCFPNCLQLIYLCLLSFLMVYRGLSVKSSTPLGISL